METVDSHIPCHVVHVVGKFYRLCSKKGVLSGRYSNKDLTTSSYDFSIPLGEWHQSPTVSLCETISDPVCLEKCNCTLSRSSFAAVDLSVDSAESDNGHVPGGSHVWHKNLLYTLSNGEREIIVSFRMVE